MYQRIGRRRVSSGYTKENVTRESANYRGISILSIPGKIYGRVTIIIDNNFEHMWGQVKRVMVESVREV